MAITQLSAEFGASPTEKLKISRDDFSKIIEAVVLFRRNIDEIKYRDDTFGFTAFIDLNKKLTEIYHPQSSLFYGDHYVVYKEELTSISNEYKRRYEEVVGAIPEAVLNSMNR